MSVPKVLFVDDEKNVLSSIQRLMHKEEFNVTVTDSPEEALCYLADDSYSVIVSDQRMPSMDGSKLLGKAREISPDTIRIILTGYADTEAAIEAINRGAVYRFLTKPWNDEEMRLLIRQAVSQFELVAENKRLHELTKKQNEELKDLNQNLEQKVQERTREISGLNQELQKSFLGSIKVMAGLAEMHSSVIGNHSKRVALICKEVAEKMGLSGDELLHVDLASMLHCIGKIGVPSAILNKSESELKKGEREIIQRHVIQGEAIVRMVPGLENVARYIRHHHENFDGSGYPDRLRGEYIPLGSRIIAVVDAYDKALNTRTVFESTTPQKALQSVLTRSSTFYDPGVLTVLQGCLSENRLETNDGVEVEVRVEDLREGMVLSRELRTSRGVLLLPRESVIKQSHLAHIQKYHESDPFVEGIFVCRGRTAQ